MDVRKKVILTLSILLFSSFSSLVLADSENNTECIILTDWDFDYELFENSDGNSSVILSSVIHRYVVEFIPPFMNGSTPHLIDLSVNHDRNNQSIGNSLNSNIVVAGGVIDIILPEEPYFRDEIQLSVETLEASCFRDIRVTNWNQPISDHEITTNRTWSNSLSDFSQNSSTNLSFEGRGWQQRIGQNLISNELGSGNFEITNSGDIDIELDLDKVWLNQTYFEEELVGQEFEMQGQGNLFTSQDGVFISVNVTDAQYNRTLSQEDFTEHLIINGDGIVQMFRNSDEEESVSLDGQISTFYFESFDNNGVRDFQQINMAASATSFIEFGDGNIALELEEFRLNDLWRYGVQEEQLFKYVGNGEFNFIVSDSEPYIYSNGTVANLHFEERDGLIIVDTLRVDGTYSGDVSGSFGIIRYIGEKTSQVNASGVNFEVNKIKNENWFNVSSFSNFPINEDFTAEHNLTYEYTVPQSNWENPTVRYLYIEDNGSTSDEYPEVSPIPIDVERPQANSIDATPITKETGVAPEVLFSGDKLKISKNLDFVLSVLVKDSREEIIDGHTVKVIDWVGDYGNDSYAYGSIINEGLLSGLFNYVNRSVIVDMGLDVDVDFYETQKLDKIRYPSVITAAENTPPSLELIQFREGFLYAEGGLAHLEITVLDVDNDIISVYVDLSNFGLGIIELSDRGVSGDEVIHDNIWTALVNAEGLEFGNKSVDIEMTDIWETIAITSSIEILNPAPTMSSIIFTPSTVYRGDIVNVSIVAADAHGVESISLELMSSGGESVDLVFTDSQWIGQFTVPNQMAPGERLIPIRMIDNYGSSRIVTEYSLNGEVFESLLKIKNEAPMIVNYSIFKDGEFSSVVQVPMDGEPIPQVLEVTINDPDGISSVQVKMGRLAPIGQSNDWILMNDNGLDGDRISGDGIYSLEVFARSSLPNGELEILVRGTDIYLSTTPPDDQRVVLDLEKIDNNPVSENWILENTSFLIILGLVFTLILSAVGVLLISRNSEFE